MASPQKEDGYTVIANEIIEALIRHRIPGEQMVCLLYILRKTYGYHKKEDAISNAQFVEVTGMKKSSVCRALRNLIGKNIVSKKANGFVPIYCFNKNYNTWKVLAKKLTKEKVLAKKLTTVSKKANDFKKERKYQRKKEDKRKLKIKSSIFFDDSSIEMRLAKLLFNLIRERDPKHKIPDWQDWAYEIDKLIRLDKRNQENIEKVIRWCQADNIPDANGFCWANNILSTGKLRKQFGQLWLKMNEKEKPSEDSEFIKNWLKEP